VNGGAEEFVRMLRNLRIKLEMLNQELQTLDRELKSLMEGENR